jgi:elongation factor G
MIKDRLGAKAFPVHYPLGEGELFTGMVDIVRRVELVYDDDSLGAKWVEGPVPDALVEQVEELRHQLVEAAVEFDEELLRSTSRGTTRPRKSCARRSARRRSRAPSRRCCAARRSRTRACSSC